MKTRSKLLLVIGLLVVLTITGLYASSRDRTPKLNLDPTLRQSYRSPLLFEILGYIDARRERQIYVEPDHFVDKFFISEKKAADEFEILLKTFIAKYNIKTEIVREDYEHHIYFYSKEISEIINSFYIPFSCPTQTIDPDDNSLLGTCYHCILDYSFFKNESEEEIISFVKGAYTRYGEKNVFMNPSHPNLLTNYLIYLRCDVKMMNLASNLPNTFVIVFNPSEKARKLFNITSFYNIILQEGDPKEPSLPYFPDTEN